MSCRTGDNMGLYPIIGAPQKYDRFLNQSLWHDAEQSISLKKEGTETVAADSNQFSRHVPHDANEKAGSGKRKANTGEPRRPEQHGQLPVSEQARFGFGEFLNQGEERRRVTQERGAGRYPYRGATHWRFRGNPPKRAMGSLRSRRSRRSMPLNADATDFALHHYVLHHC